MDEAVPLAEALQRLKMRHADTVCDVRCVLCCDELCTHSQASEENRVVSTRPRLTLTRALSMLL
jgi:hypothetical protein